MKYIVTQNEQGFEEIFLFPMGVDHDCMAEVLGSIKNHTHGNWQRVYRRPVAAGFVTNGICYGDSMTLGLKSRPEDTELLKGQYP